MLSFVQLRGIAAPLPMINVDTDKIIPKQFLKTVHRTGLGSHLFEDMRHDPNTGAEREDFVLNQAFYKDAVILITGENFGCGSSREHAPWALLDFGIRCIISPSFADIFYNNCFKNGMLPVALPKETVDLLMQKARSQETAMFCVDLQTLEIRCEGDASPPISFDVDDFRRKSLLEGADEIKLTLDRVSEIERFEAARRETFPWL